MQNRYRTDMISYEILKNKVKLPTFQRPVVWPDKDVRNFLDSIHRGFPFGSLLLFEYNGDNKLSLIDGLQRYSALQKFEKNKISYVDIDEEVNIILSYYMNDDYNSKQEKIEKEKIIRETISNVFKNTEEVNSNAMALKDAFEKTNLIMIDKNGEYGLIQSQMNINNKLESYIKLKDLKIPYVQFDGDESELSKIFEKLNRGGKTLSRFQVFAAQWSNYEINLQDGEITNKIVESTANRYLKLNESRGIEIENFDYDSFIENKKINLSELCYSLGELILEYIPYEKATDTLKEELGYNTMAIVLGVPSNKLHLIVKKIEIINSNWIEINIKKILRIYEDLEEIFSDKFNHPGKSNTYNFTFINYQYLSFFATLWYVKYDNNFETNPKFRDEYTQTLNNLVQHYLYDLVRNHWSSTGDKKLNISYMDNRNIYYNKVLKKDLEPSLNQFEKNNLESDKLNIKRKEKTLITYLLKDVQFSNEKSYDFEHIIPRKEIKKLNNGTEKIYGGNSLGNITILNSKDNRAKQNHTIYKFSDDFDSLNLNEDYLFDIYYPKYEAIKFLDDKNLLDKEKIKKSNVLIKNRSKNVSAELIKKILE